VNDGCQGVSATEGKDRQIAKGAGQGGRCLVTRDEGDERKVWSGILARCGEASAEVGIEER